MTIPKNDEAASATPDSRFGLRDVWGFAWHRILRPHLGLAAGILLLGLMARTTGLALAKLMGSLVELLQGAATGAGGVSPWLVFAAWAVVLLAAGPFLSLWEKRVSARFDQRTSSELRVAAFDAVLRRPLPFFNEQSRGMLMTLLSGTCIETQMALRQLTLDFVVQVLHLAAALGVILWTLLMPGRDGTAMNPWIVAALLGAGLAAPFLVGRFARRFREVASGMRDANFALASLTEGALRAPEEIKAFGAESRLAAKCSALFDRLGAARDRQTVTVGLANLLNSLPTDLVQVALAGIALAVAAQASGGGAGILVTILLLAPQLMQPLQGFSAVSMTFHSSLPSVQRILDLLEGRPLEPMPELSKPPVREESAAPLKPDLSWLAPAGAGPVGIRARELRFTYDPKKSPVLDGLSLDVGAGRSTALVAAMGAGKSTFFRLLLRFYEVESGSLELGGVPVTKIGFEEIRRRVGLLVQFPSFTHDTVRENFHIAAPEASDEEILRVCEITGLTPILEKSLPPVRGGSLLDRPFASGQMISGGQRKVFALARCLLRRPEVLLLDEPTTGIDNRDKSRLTEVIRAVARGRTVMVIDHDVQWLAEWCDRFAILEKGRITLAGTLDEVRAGSELFRELLRTGSAEPSLPASVPRMMGA